MIKHIPISNPKNSLVKITSFILIFYSLVLILVNNSKNKSFGVLARQYFVITDPYQSFSLINIKYSTQIVQNRIPLILLHIIMSKFNNTILIFYQVIFIKNPF